MDKIKKNLDKLEENILKACEKAGRERYELTLVAVTKAASIEQIEAAYGLGCRVFGENRLPHFQQVYEYMADKTDKEDPIMWDMIGHLQRNKVSAFLPLVWRIHSVDSLRLAKEIEKNCVKLSKKIDIFIQVNCSKEEQKHGINPDEAIELTHQICEQFTQINVAGIMTMAAFTDDELEIAKTFRLAKNLFDKIKSSGFAPECFSRLSMGMTNDYKIAIAEGATDIRVGSAIFG